MKRIKKVSLIKALSKMGIASRSVATDWIKEGKVKLGSRIIRNPDMQVEVPLQHLRINDEPVRPPQKVYYMMHKPKGVITTRSDEKGRKTIYDLLDPKMTWIFPVGRLDKESSGLLLLTNDTLWGDRILSPQGKISKIYHVKISRDIESGQLQQIRDGLVLSESLTYLPAQVRKIRNNTKSCWLEIELEEGKNRQIRKSLGHLNFKVETLVRIQIGKLPLGDLKPGEIRPISPTAVFR